MTIALGHFAVQLMLWPICQIKRCLHQTMDLSTHYHPPNGHLPAILANKQHTNMPNNDYSVNVIQLVKIVMVNAHTRPPTTNLIDSRKRQQRKRLGSELTTGRCQWNKITAYFIHESCWSNMFISVQSGSLIFRRRISSVRAHFNLFTLIKFDCCGGV